MMKQRDPRRLRLLSYNVQVGIVTRRRFDYFAQGWRHLLPHPRRQENLAAVAELIRDFDLVGLQELDGGSFRSGFINQAEYLALQAGFPHWHDQINRNLLGLARHSFAVLGRLVPGAVSNHALPGGLPGRGALVLRYGDLNDPLVVVLAHLALSSKARLLQLDYIAGLVKPYRHVIVMGDMNCNAQSGEIRHFMDRSGLCLSACDQPSYPSWRPEERIDHIFVSPTLDIHQARVLDFPLSDHLPVALEVSLPADFSFVAEDGHHTAAA